MILTIIRDGQLLAVRETVSEVESVLVRFPGALVYRVVYRDTVTDRVAEYLPTSPIALRNTPD